MKNCLEITRLLSEAQERELTLRERVSVKLHNIVCSGCRNFGSQVGVLRDICRAYTRGEADKSRNGEAPESDGQGIAD